MNDSKTNNNSSRFADIKLAIVCPMANESSTAENFVTSVLQQCQNFESVKFFAVLDNSSTDGTFDLLKNLQHRLP